MACEARIVRVLQALEYPRLEETASGSGSDSAKSTLDDRPDELARIVSWLEDRKIRHLPIADRAPLRTAGPHWDKAFFSYLREMDCPYDFKSASTGAKGEGQAGSSSARLRGLSWLVGEAAAEEFADHGQDYAEAARKILAQSPSVQVGQRASFRPASELPPHPPSAALLPEGEARVKLSPTAAGPGVETEDVGHDGGRVSSGNTAVPMDQEDGSGEDGRGDGDRVFDELEGFSAGVDTGDKKCDRVATVLRMLYLSELRTLQDEVNGILAMAQTGGS